MQPNTGRKWDNFALSKYDLKRCCEDISGNRNMTGDVQDKDRSCDSSQLNCPLKNNANGQLNSSTLPGCHKYYGQASSIEDTPENFGYFKPYFAAYLFLCAWCAITALAVTLVAAVPSVRYDVRRLC